MVGDQKPIDYPIRRRTTLHPRRIAGCDKSWPAETALDPAEAAAADGRLRTVGNRL